MNQNKYIFAQLTDFLPRRAFDRIVEKYDGYKHVRSFTCWKEFLAALGMTGKLIGKVPTPTITLSI